MEGALLSPGTLESPNQVQSIVSNLEGKNQKFEKMLEAYQHRETQLKTQLEEVQANHRKQMLKLESKSMDREQELHQQYARAVDVVQNELNEAKEKAARGEQALRELDKARDEIEMMRDSKSSLTETTEKLRVYKEKIHELQDSKEALQREQEAHGRSVDEIVRLENELQALQPVKRQVEDYKIRAIEAEVKLVECQDYLRQMEQQATDQSAANEHLWKGSVMQKEQLEELQRRILQDTQAPPQSANAGVGDGISELNPELKEELHRLRNENLQLRAFAQKRDNDEVQKLEETLDDTKRLGERYKNEFLSTKKELTDRVTDLADAKDREDKLLMQVKEISDQVEKLEEAVEDARSLGERHKQELKATRDKLEKTQTDLKDTIDREDKLLIQVKVMIDDAAKLDDALEESKLLGERYKDELARTNKELDETRSVLASTKGREEKLIVQVQETTDRVEQNENHIQSLEGTIHQLKDDWERAEDSIKEMECVNTRLEKETSDWKSKFNASEVTSMKQKNEIYNLSRELENTKSSLSTAESNIQKAEEHIAICQDELENMSTYRTNLESKLGDVEEELEQTHSMLVVSRQQCTTLEESVKALNMEQSRLENQLEDEQAAKQTAIEEADSALEATREILQSKAKKEMEDLQLNMNRLLEDERRAGRLHRDESKKQLRELDEKWRKEYDELQERYSSSLKHSREEAQERVDMLKQEHQEEIENIRKSEEDSRQTLVRKGKGMLSDATDKYKKEMAAVFEEKKELKQKLAIALKENEEVEKLLRSKISSQKNKLELSVSQVDELTRENEELQEKVTTIEREMSKLREDNDRCRRQMGGRFGGSGYQAQLEKLQKEYNEILEENRNYKKEARFGSGGMLGAIAEHHLPEDGSLRSGAYGRGGMNKEALSQLRHEYDGIIERLNDEKRELVMKSSAAATDVKKAEQRVWEGEQEISKLKDQIVSLQLALQRAEISLDGSIGLPAQHHLENQSPKDKELSFLSAREELDEKSPICADKQSLGYEHRQGSLPKTPERQRCSEADPKRSPSLEKALRDRDATEQAFRSKLLSFSAMKSSPSRAASPQAPPRTSNAELVLQSTRKHEERTNIQQPAVVDLERTRKDEKTKVQDSPRANMACDVFGLGVNKSERSSSHKKQNTDQSFNPPKTLLDYTCQEEDPNMESRPECQQS